MVPLASTVSTLEHHTLKHLCLMQSLNENLGSVKMGLFGESKTDTTQNKQLQQVIANQNAILKQQQEIVKSLNSAWTWIKYLDGQDKKGMVKDAKIDAALSGLTQTAVAIQQATKETEK